MGNKIAILGAGSWATALAALLSKKGYPVMMWARSQEQVTQINNFQENTRYLPGVFLPPQLMASTNLEEVVSDCKTVIFGTPSHAFRKILQEVLPYVHKEAVFVNTAKGIEEDSLYRMSEVFMQEAGTQSLSRYAAISGPSHAEEVGQNLPTTVVVAAKEKIVAEQVQDIFMTDMFRVYTNPDLLGVELGGALKNIIALGTGISDGLGFGDNTKAALMTRGLAEITRLGIAMGANPLTFAGLAGVGDLIVTCTSVHSRNRRAGIEIGRGKSLQETLSGINMVVEGVRTTAGAHGLAQRYDVKMPITELTYEVLFKGLAPLTAVNKLMTRLKTHEVEEVALAAVNWTK
ncbi:Glycerol-3-phosphate dehydrogenase (NAD(P)(+)) [Desulfofarcimen acetoxidans DSM 771]|jgi:glycerol-3-phosphate dehydrogenase (NAD(P)+)|uniref:Glycerol-3-phosphate dehydrogenase [NAD(P)+] n=1 Tax=Desulfofarcimen acetoxidans (strain ATCC 49208 / DSM 771 / KCTC 5769 / VKM B-1644 / 5575) TaxID=485916 RepID=C8VZ29_DESAS|nr:NAD(P)H-dependent glycerol-3-phosphate dehydrogenase [Desulfofarcimen acetoxidans]ACV62939.1 Glycerol-3-phosphate dehydrogenase (NAD(P)(+)) [Desulfofarcimen acetoxidans DSM 771]